ncbi:unnamed protein product, partial [marine sediment metagenome]
MDKGRGRPEWDRAPTSRLQQQGSVFTEPDARAQHAPVAIELHRQPQSSQLPPGERIPRNRGCYEKACKQKSSVAGLQVFRLVQDDQPAARGILLEHPGGKNDFCAPDSEHGGAKMFGHAHVTAIYSPPGPVAARRVKPVQRQEQS